LARGFIRAVTAKAHVGQNRSYIAHETNRARRIGTTGRERHCYEDDKKNAGYEVVGQRFTE